MDLKLGHHAKDGIEVIDVQGEIDMYTAPRLRELLIDLVSKGSYQLVVNLDKVGFLDSTGLGVLVGGPEAGAGPRRLAGSGLHATADPEDLPDHRADGGLRHLRHGGPGHRGHQGPPVRNALAAGRTLLTKTPVWPGCWAACCGRARGSRPPRWPSAPPPTPPSTTQTGWPVGRWTGLQAGSALFHETLLCSC